VWLLAYGIDNCHDSIISSGLWKFYNEIHADDFPTFFWDWEGVKLSNQEVALCLSLETLVAGGDLLANVARHVWPPVVPWGEFKRFEAACMSSNFGIVTEENNALAKVWRGQDMDAASKVEKAILFQPLSQLDRVGCQLVKLLHDFGNGFLVGVLHAFVDISQNVQFRPGDF